MKKCLRCEKEKNEDQFYNLKRKGRVESKHGECIMCMNTRTSARVANLKLKAIKYLGNACKICGYNKNPKAMEFHHLDPTQKDYGISTKKMLFDKMKTELDKCILLCANCHREKHDELWREGDTIDWKLYYEMVNYDEWPDLKSITYEKRFPTPPAKYCCDCHEVEIEDVAERCVKCAHIKQEKIIWPSDAELAILVWEKPRSTLAKELGISDKAIANRCTRRNISQPGRGYWSKQ